MVPLANDSSGANKTDSILPRYPLPEPQSPPRLIGAIKSVVIYIGLGYLLLQRWDLLLVIFGILLLHEGGHFVAMKYYNYSDVTILFLPFIGGLVKGTKNEISQKQSIFILLAGPVPGIILGFILHYISININNVFWGDVPLQLIAQLLIWANFINLLPIYPLDGGQLINRIYFEDEGLGSDIFFSISMIVITGVALLTKFYLLILFPAFLIYKYVRNRSNSSLDRAIEDAGINTNISYNKLPDQDYWKIRSLVIRYTTSLKHINPEIHQYHDLEYKIASEIESLLSPRMLLLDASIQIKIVLALLLIILIISPWLFNIDFLLLQYLG